MLGEDPIEEGKTQTIEQEDEKDREDLVLGGGGIGALVIRNEEEDGLLDRAGEKDEKLEDADPGGVSHKHSNSSS